jgi:adenosine deaminase
VFQTDDVGVFGSPLSNEYLLASQHFRLTQEDLIQLSLDATRDIFSPDHMKDMLRAEILQFVSRMRGLDAENAQSTVVDGNETGGREEEQSI